MLLRNRFVLLPVLTLLALLAGCSSGANSPIPPPTGAFSNTDFAGTYTFSALGSDGNEGSFAMAGSFTACGCTAGTISGGFIDLSDSTGVAPQSTISSSSTYNVNPDGRGTVTLDVTTASSGSLQIGLDFVLTSSSHGLIIRFDSGGTGSGTIDLQPAVLSQSSLTGGYTFSLQGSDPSGTPISSAGSFTLAGNGSFASTGVADFNYGATVSAGTSLTGSVLVGTAGATSAGTATLDSSFGNLTFDVYAIDATHLKLIETDGLAILVGDLYTQQTSIPQGNYVFTAAWEDTSGDFFAAGGLFGSDGASQIQNGLEDVNENGVTDGGASPATPLSFNGTFVASPSGSGRFTMSLASFAGGATFAAYPSSGGMFLVQIDPAGLNAGITSGVALAQSSTAIASSTGYGLNLTGVDLTNTVELDEIAEFTASSSAMTGLVDVNDDGPESPKNLAGTYTQASNGEGSATFTAGGFAGMFFYTADDTSTLLLSTDTNQVALGLFQTQTTPSSSAKASRIASAVSQHAAMLKIISMPRRGKSAAKSSKLGHNN